MVWDAEQRERYFQPYEERKEYYRQYYLKNRDEKIKQHRQYRLDNKDKVIEYSQKYYEENKAKKKKWRLQYKNKHKTEMHANALAKRVELAETCTVCGVEENLERHHPDYSKPLDVVTLCRSCHKRIHAGDNQYIEILRERNAQT